MTSIFDRLFYRPMQSQKPVYDPTLEGSREEYQSKEAALREQLCPKQDKLLSKLLNSHTDLLAYEAEDTFQTGVCLGMMLMMEVVQTIDTHFWWEE